MLIENGRKLIYPDLSYKIVGAAFKVYNEIGYGFSEKVYQKALGCEFLNIGVKFNEEVYVPLEYKGEKLVKYFADFVVEQKILVELKVVKKLSYSHAKQLLAYLRASGIKLGLLVYFTGEGVKYRRVLNSQSRVDSHY